MRSRQVRIPLLLAAVAAHPAAGQVSTWDPTVVDGLWSKPASWIGGQLPVAGSEVRLNASGDTDVTATFDVGTSPAYGSIYLQNQGTGTARFTLRVDDPLAKLAGVSMSVGSVGSGGSARVVQTQGTVTTTLGGVSLGDGENASGAYEL
jgi:hypothetical protein